MDDARKGIIHRGDGMSPPKRRGRLPPPGSCHSLARRPPCLAASAGRLGAPGDAPAGLQPTAVMDPAAWRAARALADAGRRELKRRRWAVIREGGRCFQGRKHPFGKRTGLHSRTWLLQDSVLAFVATGTNLSLQFFPASWQGEQRQTPSREYVDLEREAGKVYLKAPMILNGVCVIWKGWIDLQRLDGMGCLEFDEERAQQEDALARHASEEARRRTREFEDRDRSHREEMEVRVSQLLAVSGKKTTRP
ncbi:core-binding factor subunit beta [Myotis lucifugus]|uniref:core-binding factor subunit beta n=1 Tax=Myotis lucifugus TaxID=59463 RepID=UPI0006D70BC8|nr:core-binding factor subunit beta [Myotis lucifugus]